MHVSKPTVQAVNRQTIKQLNHLIRLNKDSKEGLRIAAESVKNRVVVRLFEGDANVKRAAQALHDAGYPRESISTLVFNRAVSVHENGREGSTLVETTGAGVVSGALAGKVLGFAAGVTTLLIPDVDMAFATTMAGALAIVTFVGLAIGALFGAFFGALIGLGIVEQDTYLYQNSIRPGQILMLVRTDSKRATEAALIMQRVNLAQA